MTCPVSPDCWRCKVKTNAEYAAENEELRRLLIRIINGAREVCLANSGHEPWEKLTEEIPEAADCKRLGLRGLKKWVPYL